MGCTVSKRSSRRSRCPQCRREDPAYSPIHRSLSMRIPPPTDQKKKNYERHHVFSLQSSMELRPFDEGGEVRDQGSVSFDYRNHDGVMMRDKEIGLIEARAWSKMIGDKMMMKRNNVVMMTPTMTPPGEPEKINAWELMEGLEDISPLRPRGDYRRQSFSFNYVPSSDSRMMIKDDGGGGGFGLDRKSLEIDSSSKNVDLIAETIESDFDPCLISLFKKAFQELPPTNPFHLNSLDHDHDQDRLGTKSTKMNGFSDLQTVQVKGKEPNGVQEREMNGVANGYGCGGKGRVVVYFTSLRGVRKTYEDCCDVRVILRSLGVRVDERDVSMHSGFRDELRERLGSGFSGGGLPRVFAGEKYIGGAEEIRRMHEEGKLQKFLEGFKMMNCDGGREDDGGFGICDACGDVRFVPCETCSGSCKIYYDVDGQEDDGRRVDHDEGEFGFRRCPDCNENGLVRCPICCDYEP